MIVSLSFTGRIHLRHNYGISPRVALVLIPGLNNGGGALPRKAGFVFSGITVFCCHGFLSETIFSAI